MHETGNLTLQLAYVYQCYQSPKVSFMFRTGYVLLLPKIKFVLICCRNWELLAPWTGAQIKIPVKFMVGDLDITYHIPGIREYIQNGGFKKDVPGLQEVIVMEGVAHFINQEKADEVSSHIYDFIKQL